MSDYNKILLRQLKKCGIKNTEDPPADGGKWQGLLNRISGYYQELDETRARLERSLEKSNSEMEERADLLNVLNKEISDILNCIDQGIFTINPDFTINPEHSKFAEKILDCTDFANASIASLLNCEGDDEVNAFKNWMVLMENPSFLKRWKRFSMLCPVGRVDKGYGDSRRVLDYKFRPMIESGKLYKLMILVADITAETVANERFSISKREQELQMNRIISVTDNDAATLAMFFSEIEGQIKTFKRVREIEALYGDADEFFRELHTLKGNAGTFGFRAMADRSGNMEDLMDAIVKQTADETLVMAKWNSGIQFIQDEFQSMCDVRAMIEKGSTTDMVVHQGRYLELIEKVENGEVNSVDDILDGIHQLRVTSFNNVCNKYGNIVKVNRAKLEKDIMDICIENGEQLIHADSLAIFDVALMHLVRNAVDHGIESRDVRIMAGKSSGRIDLRLDDLGDEYCVTIRDDGAGINFEHVCKTAIDKGIITVSQCESMDENEKINLIFRPGFTTKTAITDLSGRGVGMDAARDILRRHGGRIDVSTRFGQGTIFKLYLPKSHKKRFHGQSASA